MKKVLYLTCSLLLLLCLTRCSEDSGPQAGMPQLKTGSARVTGRTGAIISGTVTLPEGTKASECGFLYSTASAVPDKDAKKVGINVDRQSGTYEAELTGLVPRTTYYYCLYAVSGTTRVRSDIEQFTTDADGNPVLVLPVASGLTESAVTVSSRLTDDGGHDISGLGFCYKVGKEGDSNPNTTTDKVANVDKGLTEFSTELTGLEPETGYIICAYGLNSSGFLGYSTPLYITTKAATKPILSAITNKTSTATSITVEAKVADQGAASVTDIGFCWSSENQLPTIEGELKTSCKEQLDHETFSTLISNLQPNTSYYIRAYAINKFGTGYSEALTFATGDNRDKPVVETSPVQNVEDTSARLVGKITSDGNTAITARGFFYGTDENPVANGSKYTVTTATDIATFAHDLTNLTPGTTYHVCAYAENEIGISYGAVRAFTTKAASTPPTVSATGIADITETGAVATATVTDDGGLSITQKGFYYSSTNPTPGENDSKVLSTGSGNGITVTFTDLEPHTQYYIRAFATNSKGTGMGAVKVFSTVDNRTKPTVETKEAQNITENGVRLSGEVTSKGGGTMKSRGFFYGTKNNPAVSGTRIEVTFNADYFSHDLSGLAAGTTYYYCAYAENELGVSYGEVKSFTTVKATTAPGVGLTAVSSITTNSAKAASSITDDGGLDITEKGFYYSSVNATPTANDAKAVDLNAGYEISATLSNLTMNTRYYIRAFATNSKGTTLGEVQQFTTLDDRTVPEVTTLEAVNIGENTARLVGQLVSNGGSTLTAKGFYWSTSRNPLVTGTRVEVSGAATTYTADISGLDAATAYYYIAFAENEKGAGYGNEVTFNTQTATYAPTVSNTTVSGVTDSGATAEAFINDDGGLSITDKGFYYSNVNENPGAADRVLHVTSEGNNIRVDLTGLQSNTRYYIRAFATNKKGTSVGYTQTFQTLEYTEAPTMELEIATPDTTSVVLTGNIVSTGGSTLKEVGFCYSDSNTEPNTAGTKVTATLDGNRFTTKLTGLKEGQTYYIRAYAINATKVGYSSVKSCTTHDSGRPNPGDNPSPGY